MGGHECCVEVEGVELGGKSMSVMEDLTKEVWAVTIWMGRGR